MHLLCALIVVVGVFAAPLGGALQGVTFSVAAAQPARVAPARVRPDKGSRMGRIVRLRTKQAVRATASLAKGMGQGAKHTWHAIKTRPGQYLGILGGMALLGAGAKWTGLDPEPLMLGVSAVAFGYSLYGSAPKLRGSYGRGRLRAIGSEVIWPALLVVATSVAGHSLSPSSSSAMTQAIAQPLRLSDFAHAGGQTITMGIDIPTILTTSGDHQAQSVSAGHREPSENAGAQR